MSGDWKKIPQDPEHIAKLCEAALLKDHVRLTAQKDVDKLDAEVKEIKEVIRLVMNKCQMTEVKTHLGMVRLAPKTVYQMDPDAGGWPKIWAYITKHKAWDLVEKRLHQGACKARYDDKQKIPGVKTFEMVHVKLGDAE